MIRGATASIMALLAGSVLAGCAREGQESFVGYVEAEYVYVAALEAGRIEALHATEGDRVAEGDPLFDLNATRQSAELAAAEARLAQAAAEADDLATGARAPELEALRAQAVEAQAMLVRAKAERDRWMPLVREGNASAARGDQVEADYRAAAARVRAAEEAIKSADLGGRDARRRAAEAARDAAAAAVVEANWRRAERSVSAGIAGPVERVLYRAGETAPAGGPVVAILPDDRLKVRFFAPQAALPRLAVGALVDVIADGVTQPLRARIDFIAAEAEFTPPVIYSASTRDKLVFLVEARLPPGSALAPGLPVDVRLVEAAW